ncbi:MAG TPA: hypothetical protein VGK02_07510 [Candidatus Aquicultor sp.]|jgi:hypothetical protein
MSRFNYSFRNHSQQLNLYAWLVPYKIERLQAAYMDMKGIKICDAPLWSEREIETLFDQKLPVLDTAFKHGILPPADYTNWRCNGWCNVKSICSKLHEEELISHMKKQAKIILLRALMPDNPRPYGASFVFVLFSFDICG